MRAAGQARDHTPGAGNGGRRQVLYVDEVPNSVRCSRHRHNVGIPGQKTCRQPRVSAAVAPEALIVVFIRREYFIDCVCECKDLQRKSDNLRENDAKMQHIALTVTSSQRSAAFALPRMMPPGAGVMLAVRGQFSRIDSHRRRAVGPSAALNSRPWASSQPSRVTKSSCAGCSTPSATTPSCSA